MLLSVYIFLNFEMGISAEGSGAASRPEWTKKLSDAKCGAALSSAASSALKKSLKADASVDPWLVVRERAMELALHVIQPNSEKRNKSSISVSSAAKIFSAALDGVESSSRHGNKSPRDELASLIIDVFWYVGLEVSNKESDAERGMSESWKRLCDLITRLQEMGALKRDMLVSQLELDLVEGCNLGSAKDIKRRLTKENTNMFYRQQKYNLLSEESEGYAKLMTELQMINSSNVEISVRNMQSLVGYFHLDPNRVFDIVLDSYESNAANDAFMRIFDLLRFLI